MATIWKIGAANPKRRKRKAGSGKKRRRSAAQRAATRRMLAANRGSSPVTHSRRKRRGRKRSAGTAVAVRHSRRSRRSARRSSVAGMGRGLFGTALNLAKAGAVGAGGAIVVDAGMGFAARVLPVEMTSKVDPATGGINIPYYAIKGALAVALASFGRKLPVVGKYAPEMATGSFVVMAYELARGLMPATVGQMLGYYNAAPVVGAYVDKQRRLSAYVGPVVPIRSGSAAGAGARAASMMRR